MIPVVCGECDRSEDDDVRGSFIVLLAAARTLPLLAAEPNGTAPAANVCWRFDGSGHFPDVRPVAEWGEGKNILWKTAVGAGGYSSPIVVKDRVFVTAEMGSLICLDLAGGRVLWSKDLFGESSKDIPAELSKKLMRGCGGDSKQSTPTPASNGELVFYVNAMGLCACYDLGGNLKWIRIVETAEDEEHFTSSPIFLGDRIILTWGCLLALDAKDGHTLWKAPDAKAAHGSAVIARIGGDEVAITPAGDIVRVADGQVLASGLFQTKYATPLVEGKVLYIVDAKARAFELPANVEKGMRLKELWKTEMSGEFMSSPAYRDGLLYTTEGRKCRVCILDAKTGQLLTTTRVVGEATKGEVVESGVKVEGLAAAQYVYASPVVTERNVFYFDDGGRTAVLELGREHTLVRVNRLADGLAGTPFFVRDRILVRGTKAVYCIAGKP
jgi:outer membrane protein assembly factor BamB